VPSVDATAPAEDDHPMRRIVVSENVTLDGVMEDPSGREGSERGGWFAHATEADQDAFARLASREATEASAILLGRRSDRWFADHWTTRTGPWAERLNSMPRYVISSTSTEAAWNGATVLRGDPLEEAAALRDRTDGDVVVYASARLVGALLDADLVDELRLLIYPVVLGSGRRLFQGGAGTDRMRPVEARRAGDGLVLLTYARIDAAAETPSPPVG
jgi:dihydrofolate reductase